MEVATDRHQCLKLRIFCQPDVNANAGSQKVIWKTSPKSESRARATPFPRFQGRTKNIFPPKMFCIVGTLCPRKVAQSFVLKLVFLYWKMAHFLPLFLFLKNGPNPASFGLFSFFFTTEGQI